jgi:hypothetical protein
MSGMFCGSGPPLARPIPQRRTDVGRPLALGVAWPFGCKTHEKGPANSSPRNMVANPPKIRILPTAAK